MRLLSLAPSNTEILYALGLGDHIIGVTAFCDYPKDARSKPKVGGWTTPLPEKIKSLRPDLIFTSYYLPPELKDWSDPGRIVHVAPTTLKEVYGSIMTIAEYTSTIAEGKRVVRQMKAGFSRIQKSRPKGTVNVYMEEWVKPPMASGNWVPELVAVAGGQEGMVKTGMPSCEYKFAALKAFKPQVMIFHWCGFGTRFNRKLIIERDGWSQLDAVKNGRMFVIDDALLNRPGPRLVEGAKHIQKIFIRVGRA